MSDVRSAKDELIREQVEQIRELTDRINQQNAPDPRLPGERRVPMQPGLYLATYRGCEEWCYLAWVDGESPYLQVYAWKIQVTGQDLEPPWNLGRGELYFGPCLAGPEWRKITDEHLHRVPEADGGNATGA